MINQDPNSTTQPSTPTTPIANNTFEQHIIDQDFTSTPTTPRSNVNFDNFNLPSTPEGAPTTTLTSPPPAPRLTPADIALLRENNIYGGMTRSERLAARLIGFVGFNLNQSCRPNKYLSRNPHDYNDKGNGSGRPSRGSSMACC